QACSVTGAPQPQCAPLAGLAGWPPEADKASFHSQFMSADGLASLQVVDGLACRPLRDDEGQGRQKFNGFAAPGGSWVVRMRRKWCDSIRAPNMQWHRRQDLVQLTVVVGA